MELRHTPRLPVDYHVWFTTPSQTVQKGTMYDLSSSGCAVATLGSVAPGTDLHLTILAPGYRLPITIEAASVRWSVLGEFGVEFTRLGAEERSQIARLLDHTTGRQILTLSS